MNIHLKPVIFTIQNKNFVIKDGCIQNEFDVSKTQWEYLRKIVDILSLYDNSKISTSFKDTFLYIFKKCVQDKIEESFHILKQSILKIRDIRWLLLEMEKYPQLFHFTEEDLLLMKENNASRDNIYLVKKFLKKDGDYEDYYPEEKGGGIKCKYHMTGGSLNGEYKEWHQNAQLYIQQYYKDSKLEGECKMWYPNRKIDIQHYYKDEKNEGECKWQPQNGQLYFQGYYKEDKKEGECKWWYENGQIDSQGYYKEGKRDGEWKHWNEDGTLKEKIIYKDGEKQV
jgi:antitoxin component YwqK of YwqJK toxin-antitoxin module